MAEVGKLKSVLALRLEFPDWDPIKWLFWDPIRWLFLGLNEVAFFGLLRQCYIALCGAVHNLQRVYCGLALRVTWMIGEQRGNGRSLPADF